MQKKLKSPLSLAAAFYEKLIEKRLSAVEERITQRIAKLEDDVARKVDAVHSNMTKSMGNGNSNILLSLKVHETNIYRQLTAYMELRRILDGELSIPPLRGFAISPDFALYMMEILNRYKPKAILEFGSGFSSLVLSRYAAAGSATVLSLDHERDYGEKTTQLLRNWGYDGVHTLVLADVVEQGHGAGTALFYDRAALPSGRTFDFVLLDGPPQAFGLTVRGGMLPLFRDVLDDGCILLLDDYYRPGERSVVADWVRDGWVEIIEENKSVEKHSAVLRLKEGVTRPGP